QRQKWCMNVEGRQGNARQDDAIDARASLHDSAQLRGALEYYVAAALFDEGRITNELEGVTESLLGIEQYGFAVQKGTIPARLWKGRESHAFHATAPFVSLPALIE